MANTIDIYGDMQTSSMILNKSIAYFEDDKITSIGNYGFAYQNQLTSVSLPNLESISVRSFSYCSSLSYINFPKVTSSGDAAFSYCSSLANVNLPELRQISSYTFERCRSLISISLPKLVVGTGYNFSSCSSLYGINLPKARVLNRQQFDKCTSLTNVNIPVLRTMDYYFFSSCSSLTSVSFYMLNKIENSALTNNTSIRTLNILNPYYMCTLASTSGISSYLANYGTINVRQKFYNKYLTATNWSTLNNITSVSDLDKDPIIFYIDDSSDEVVEFYDKNGNVMYDVNIGSSPASYTIIDQGSSGKPKYYSYYINDISYGLKWGYSGILTNAVGTAIGTGKSNTNTVLSITDTSGATDTLWDWLKDLNNNSASGYNDWFIPSKDEVDALKSFIDSHDDPNNGIIDFINGESIFSSSEVSSSVVWSFYFDKHDYGNKIDNEWRNIYVKTATFTTCAIRSF